MSPVVRALVFDAYGTLFDPLSVHASAEEQFPGHGAALSQLWRAKQLEYSWLRTLMGRYEDFWKLTEDALVFACRALHLPDDSAKRHQLMRAYLALPAFPEVKSTLIELSSLPLAILSNGTPGMLTAVVSANRMTKVFQHIFSVDSQQAYKPLPEVYQSAVDALALPKESIGFVSSNYWDIAGATNFGLQTFWLNRNSAVPDELGVTPKAIFRNLEELSSLLAR